MSTKIDTTVICFTAVDNGIKTIREVGGKLGRGPILDEPIILEGLNLHSGSIANPMGGGFHPIDPVTHCCLTP